MHNSATKKVPIVIDNRLNDRKKPLAKFRTRSLLASGFLFLLPTPALSQTPSLYTVEQAEQGEAVYEEQCAVCHGYNLEGFEFVPSLNGNFFSRRWGDRPISDLANSLQRMPPTQPGGLGSQAYSHLLAFLLQRNGGLAGATPLAIADLSGLTIPTQPLVPTELNPSDPSYDTNGPLVPVSRLNSLTPVTDAMLLNPPADDWLIWRRTHENLGHSPLA